MYNTSQIRFLFVIFSISFITFIVLNLSMWMASSIQPNLFWVPKQFFGVDFVEENYQRVQGVKLFYRRQNKSGEDSLIVFLGLSSASEGISIKELNRKKLYGANSNHHLLSLSGAGRNFKEIDIYASPLINSTLKPKKVFIAINPFHLMDSLVEHQDLTKIITGTPLNKLLGGWFNINRDNLKHLLDINILYARTKIFSVFGNNIDERKIDPWNDSTLMGISQLTQKKQWQNKILEYGNRGYFESKNYHNSQLQISILSKLIKKLRAKNTKVIILLMPEHKSLFDSVPTDATAILLTKLQKLLPNKGTPDIINFRQAIPDDGFNDISHMNAKGRKMFTALLEPLIIENKK